MSTILPRPSVSPLPAHASFVSPPVLTYRAVPFSAALQMVVLWLAGRQPRSTARDRQLEDAVVRRLIEELPDEPEGPPFGVPTEPVAQSNEKQSVKA